MLGFRIEPDRTATGLGEPLGQRDHLSEGGNVEHPIETAVGRTQLRDPLDRAQCLQFGEGEILAEPATHQLAINPALTMPVGKLGMVGDIGGEIELIVVTRQQHPVTAHHQIGFEKIGPLQGRQRIGGKGVFRQIAAGAAVGDQDGLIGSHGHPRFERMPW